MRILLQFPEGLKQYALEYAEKLKKEGNEVIISASQTFGACDLALDEARSIKADLLIHYGHAEFHKVDFNVRYEPFYIDADLSILERSLEYIKDYNVIGVVTTIQHIRQLDKIKEFYEKNGKRVIIGRPYGFAKHNGQILGCDIGAAATIDKDVDCHVYFGGGIFHPLGAVLNTKKPFIAIDPFNKIVEVMDKYRIIYAKKKAIKMLKAKDAKSFGILVSTKNGQYNMNLANVLKRVIESKGLSAYILVSNTINFDELNNIKHIDAFVNTACPRIAIDDTDRLNKPLLSANELMELLSSKS